MHNIYYESLLKINTNFSKNLVFTMSYNNANIAL